MKKTPIIVDGDPGHDDAIAWVYAQACGAFDIRAVTSVAGNQTIEKVTFNARRICALAGIAAPIAEGAHRYYVHIFRAVIFMANPVWMGRLCQNRIGRWISGRQ